MFRDLVRITRLAGLSIRIARIASLRPVASEALNAGEASDVSGTPDSRSRPASGSSLAGGRTSNIAVECPARFSSAAYITAISSAPLMGPANPVLQKTIFIQLRLLLVGPRPRQNRFTHTDRMETRACHSYARELPEALTFQVCRSFPKQLL